MNTTLVGSDPAAHLYQAVQPSQSLTDVRCAIWRVGHAETCPDAATLAGLYFPQLTQSPSSLYVPWLWCAYSSFGADGFNVEYLPTRRAIVIHCYLARPFVWTQPRTMIARAQTALSLLLVPTTLLPGGPVSIIEDDRIEHLVGDQSSEARLGTATIS